MLTSIVYTQKLYDYVIPVEPIYSSTSANLHLMRRLDLHAALTKINLWKLTQFRKVVYVDADMVALRVPEELFDVDADFAAAPDAGWPDCFNSVCASCANICAVMLNVIGFDGSQAGLRHI
jgi:glycogenin glucosyltransferase